MGSVAYRGVSRFIQLDRSGYRNPAEAKEEKRRNGEMEEFHRSSLTRFEEVYCRLVIGFCIDKTSSKRTCALRNQIHLTRLRLSCAAYAPQIGFRLVDDTRQHSLKSVDTINDAQLEVLIGFGSFNRLHLFHAFCLSMPFE